MKKIYVEMPPISRAKAERALRSKKNDQIIDALIRLALHDREWKWVQKKCLQFLSHEDPWVRGAAATALGHLARIHKILDLETVLPPLQSLSADTEMGDKARDALDDIKQFVGFAA